MAWRFDDITAFLHVYEAGGITAAAERLNLSKSVVSKRLRDLEDALGAELFRRTTRSLVPTERGAALYERMRAAVRDIDEALDEAGGRDGSLHGHLRISAPMSFGTLFLGPVIFTLARRHPALSVALDLDDRIVDLVGGGYDVAVRIDRMEESSLVARRLCTSRRVVCCSPGYAAARGLPAGVDDLARHDCIDYANLHSGRLWQFAGAPPVDVRGRIVANNGEAMRDAALAGLGLAVLPRFIAAAPLAAGTLVEALPGAEPVPDTIYAVYPPTRHVAPKVRVLIDHLVATFAVAPPWER